MIEKVLNRFGYYRKKQGARFKAAEGNRILADWVTKTTALNELIRSNLVRMRSRCRELARDDDYARAFINLCRINVVGPEGVKLEMNVQDDNGKLDTKAADKIKKAWDIWCKKQYCTVTGTQTFQDVCQQIISTTPQDGEFLVEKVAAFDNRFQFALRLIETDCLDEEYNARLGDNSVRMGIERNAWRAPVAYHIKSENPYEISHGQQRIERKRIAAKHIIHGFIPLFPNQVRGWPWLGTAAFRLMMMNGYDEAVLVSARTAACRMGFMVPKPDANGNYHGDATDADGSKIMEAEPGAIEELPMGFEFQEWDPTQPTDRHQDFVKSTLRAVAGSLGVAYNSLGNDLEGVNFSSIRAGLLNERDGWKMVQKWLIVHFCEEVFSAWLENALLTKEVDLPFWKFDKFNQPAFIGRRWPWVDPEKDIKAKILAIMHGLDTRTDAIAEGGGSIAEVNKTLQEEKSEAERMGLKLPKTLDGSDLADESAAKQAEGAEEKVSATGEEGE